VSGSRVYYRRASDTTARTLEMVSAGKPPTCRRRRAAAPPDTPKRNVYLSRPTLPRAQSARLKTKCEETISGREGKPFLSRRVEASITARPP